MNFGTLARAALPLVWLALSVPCFARQGGEPAGRLPDPPSSHPALSDALRAPHAPSKRPGHLRDLMAFNTHEWA